MKMMIEISGGCLVCITATQECSIYLVDHDNLREGTQKTILHAEEAMQPDCITNEEGQDETPIFDAALDEALLEYRIES